MRIGFLIALLAAIIVSVVIIAVVAPSVFFPTTKPDMTTHSMEVAGFYGRGDYAGELLESDIIVTNVTDAGNGTVLSQSIKFKGAVCQRTQGEGRVFLDGSRSTEPDAIYRVYINDILQFSHPMELGNSAILPSCLTLTEKDYVVQGQTIGTVKAELVVYVHDFVRGAGGYSVLAYDTARLT